MGPEPSPSGFGRLADLSGSAHFCIFYQTENNLQEMLSNYFGAGLAKNEFCLFVSWGATVESAKDVLLRAIPSVDRNLQDHSAEIISAQDSFFKKGIFGPARAIDFFQMKLDEALTDGYARMRVLGKVDWIDKKNWERFSKFEGELDTEFDNKPISFGCMYASSGFSATNVLDIARTHQLIVAKRNGNWEIFEASERLYDELKKSHEQLRALSRRLVEVQETELKSLARALHDDVSQTLSGIIMQLGTAKALVPKSAKPAREILNQTEALVQKTLEGTRSMITTLRPQVLDDLGLVPALRYLGKEFQDSGVSSVKVEADHWPEGVPVAVEVALFRIVQEALSNVRKHAQAKNVHIRLVKEGDLLVLSVQDDGIGLEMQKARSSSNRDKVIAGGWMIPSGHFGLIGIQERAAQLGGRLEIHSAPGAGTTLRVELPVSQEEP